MKTMLKIAMMAALLFIGGNTAVNAQRGMRGERPDSLARDRQWSPEMQFRMQNEMMRRHLEMWHAPARQMHPGMAWDGPGYRYGFRQGPGNFGRPGFRGPGAGRNMIESIPDLTDKQKSDLEALGKKHQEEMQKFREESAARAKSLREANRKKMLELLTPEQRKYVEEKFPAPVAPATKK